MSDSPTAPDADDEYVRITLRLPKTVHQYFVHRAYQNKVAKRGGESVTALIAGLCTHAYRAHEQEIATAHEQAVQAGLVTR